MVAVMSFPAAARSAARLHAMIDRVADDVDQRIADILHHLAVELDLAAAGGEAYLLARFLRQVAHDPRQRREQLVDPLHPHLADRMAHAGDRIRQAVERGDQCRIGPRFAQHPGEFVAREDDVGDARHHAVEQRQRHPDRAPPLPVGKQVVLAAKRDARDFDRRIGFGLPAVERGDDRAVVARGLRPVAAQHVAQFAQPVDDRQHGGDEHGVGRAVAAADLVERILGGMRQRRDARQGQKARTALDRVDEPKDRVEPLAIGGVGLPRDDRPRRFGKDFRRLGQKIVQQIVHRGIGAPQNPARTMADNG
jgi:hypothetical protein